MNFNEIKKMAKGMGINTYGMKKVEVIRSIQRAENNIDCYGTDRVETCDENECLWRDDCLSLNAKKDACDDLADVDNEQPARTLQSESGVAIGDVSEGLSELLTVIEAPQRRKAAEYMTGLPDSGWHN
jgi:hypothetical protein